MGRLLDEALKEAAQLQERLEAVNNKIYGYQNHPNLEIEAEKQIQTEAIDSFLELLKLPNNEKLKETLQKYMIRYDYKELVGPENYRPAVSHEYIFYLKDFKIEAGVILERYHDQIDSHQRAIYNDKNLNFRDKQIPTVLAECVNLTAEEIEDYAFIFKELFDADIEDYSRFSF